MLTGQLQVCERREGEGMGRGMGGVGEGNGRGWGGKWEGMGRGRQMEGMVCHCKVKVAASRARSFVVSQIKADYPGIATIIYIYIYINYIYI